MKKRFFFIIAVLSSVGLPGLNGFVGEFLILVSLFKYKVVLGILGSLGVVLGAYYMLRVTLAIFFGAENVKTAHKDIGWREGLLMLPIVILIFIMGIARGYETHGSTFVQTKNHYSISRRKNTYLKPVSRIACFATLSQWRRAMYRV